MLKWPSSSTWVTWENLTISMPIKNLIQILCQPHSLAIMPRTASDCTRDLIKSNSCTKRISWIRLSNNSWCMMLSSRRRVSIKSSTRICQSQTHSSNSSTTTVLTRWCPRQTVIIQLRVSSQIPTSARARPRVACRLDLAVQINAPQALERASASRHPPHRNKATLMPMQTVNSSRWCNRLSSKAWLNTKPQISSSNSIYFQQITLKTSKSCPVNSNVYTSQIPARS